ncbi:shikimate dehydrogenase [Amphritea balenae]|uniref:Shikimate dehydrogenase (NADP(+)) n=1 Tax=Amphritea balenae TaxID=452629 RepID=A0A3P1SP08_9GAMM|nr:shikimate dehydrogenase [Amphritea balenae]RRC98867.1 shikimate dehydrogenase [Amphritea balenae]GGK62411.1 shikimate dehydrogenase (NADP(+)) [Amphritea balenae]
MTDRYAVFGNPIKHSKSPLIHTAFAQQTVQDLEYHAVLVPEDGFAEAVDNFLTDTGKGLNITIPFKEEAWQKAQNHSDRARLAGAVNTLYRNAEGELCGDNTDGLGLVTDITVNNGGEIRGKTVLILGAGGAVRGVLEPILVHQPARLVIANRTPAKAETLANLFSEYGAIEACGFDQLEGQQFDLVINGTAASLQGEVPPLPADLLADNAWCYDMMYSAETTAFNCWAAENGAAKVMDGLGMLVEQAAESFAIWRGVRPDTSEVIQELRHQLLAK